MPLMAKRVEVTPLLAVGGGYDSALEAASRLRSGRRANVRTLSEAKQVLLLVGERPEDVEKLIATARARFTRKRKGG